MAGCLRSTVLLALHSKLIETIGRLPELFEKLQENDHLSRSELHRDSKIVEGHLFIISAPSGAGKSTLLMAILKKDPALRYSISCTTRPPRGNERHGVDYYFISEAAFRRKIDSGEFAEWAEVHGHLYGTPAKFLEDGLRRGYDILFDIDVEGARGLYAKYPEATLVFIAPPSMTELKRRLAERGTDSDEAIERRLKNATAEMARAKWYHHVIVNDDLARAISELRAIIEKTRLHE